VRTQGQYQAMDAAFLGLIFSCFSSDATSHVHKLEVTAFQAEVDDNSGSGSHGGSHGGSNGSNGGGGGCSCAPDGGMAMAVAKAAASLNVPGAFGSRAACRVHGAGRSEARPVITASTRWKVRGASAEAIGGPELDHP